MAEFSANATCYQSLRDHAYGEYLCTMLLPVPLRDAVAAILALDLELRLIAVKVGEEMIAHIRYAWWREGLDAIIAGTPPRAHPVLQAIAERPLPCDMLQLSVDAVQERWPEHIVAPMQQTLDACYAVLAENLKVQSRFEKALGVVRRHEARHGGRKKPLLAFKLLFVR